MSKICQYVEYLQKSIEQLYHLQGSTELLRFYLWCGNLLFKSRLKQNKNMLSFYQDSKIQQQPKKLLLLFPLEQWVFQAFLATTEEELITSRDLHWKFVSIRSSNRWISYSNIKCVRILRCNVGSEKKTWRVTSIDGHRGYSFYSVVLNRIG